MQKQTLKFMKLRDDAVIPFKAHATDAGYDLVLLPDTGKPVYNENKAKTLDKYNRITGTMYGTGIAAHIPEGYVGLIVPRSSSIKTFFTLSNTVGVIDSGYRGEIKVVVRDNFFLDTETKLDEDRRRLFQLVIIKLGEFEVEEVTTLEESPRGEGGFGSSGKSIPS